MNIYLVRHGETDENRKGVYYGKLDAKLNENGKIQVRKAAIFFRNIPLDAVYRSVTKRTEETVEFILTEKYEKQSEPLKNEIPLILDSRLNELNFGVFEGKTYEEIKRLYPKQCEIWDADWKGFSPEDGESFLHFYERIKLFIEEIKELPYENILIATHGGVIKTILCYILGENLDLFWKFGSKNADIALLKYEYGNFYIDFIQHI